MTRDTWRQQMPWITEHAVDGVITVAALGALGIDSSTAYRRCQPGGPWRWLLPGVVLLQSGTPSGRQRTWAALAYAGSGAQLTGACAAMVYGLRRAGGDDRVHVLLPHSRRCRSVGWALVERTTRLPEPVVVRGLPAAPVVRAVMDRARRLRDAEAVQALLAEAVQRRFCTPAQLTVELDAGSTRGTALVRHELEHICGGARSVAEVRAKRLAQRSGLPEPLWNVPLFDDCGQLIGTPDAWWPEVGLAWEIDSLDFHLDPADYDRTLRRDARYAAAGIAFLPTLPSRLVTEFVAVVAELTAAYAAAARRPLPGGVTIGARPA
ncbi:MAG: hypothetical protein GEV09_15075 [Pseudonocardiaceae bacterium]|nr:hypothetical protein [Pseudonocardiaceae bacterium]